MRRSSLYITLGGYGILVYLVLLMPFHLYTPVRSFDLPSLLWFTHLILLYIHEAGHLFFSVFGSTMSILGGSLNQLLAPLLWFVVAKREGSSLSNVALVFTGVSIVDISIYVKDAEVLALPLIGGLSKAHHDWRNLLSRWEMLEYGFLFGEMLFWTGMILSVFGIYSGVRTAVADYQSSRNKDKEIHLTD